jgi:hypothetical protein
VNNIVSDYVTPSVLLGSVAAVATLLSGLYRATRSGHRAFWSAAALLLSWFFAALALSWLGFYKGSQGRIPTIQYGVLIPIVVGIVLFWRWRVLNQIVQAVPQQWIVGVQTYRVLGVIFLMLYADGKLPGEFARPAGAGDVLVGLLAPLLAIAYARGWRGSTWLLRAWNLLGIADLVVAITTGFLTSPSPLQRLALDRPNVLISEFPLVMIPVFLVPLAVLLHLASLYKLRQTATGPHVPNPLLTAWGS